MKKIAIPIETRQGEIKPSMYGVITAAQGSGHELFALVFDSDGAKYTNQLKNFGINKLVAIIFREPADGSNPDIRARVIIQAMDHFKINTLFSLTSLEGKDLIPRVAARLDAPLVMDCLPVNLAESTVEKPQFSGKTIATVRCHRHPPDFRYPSQCDRAETDACTDGSDPV